MRGVAVALAGLALASGGLATFPDVCAVGANDAFVSTKACCTTSVVPKRRHLYSRTDVCSDGSTPCCDTKAQGPPKVTSGGTTDLQCGKNFDPLSDPQDVPNGVAYSLEPCTIDASGTCLHVKLTAAPGQTISDIHLAILDGSGDPSTLPNGLGQWPFNQYCSFVGNEGNCWVPVSVVLSVLNPGSTSLCSQDIIVAAGISIASATCFGRGTVISNDAPPARWFMYSTVAFTCPDVCTHSCCCPYQPPDHWCDIGTAFGYKEGSAINFNGNPVGPALTATTCKRWGWYYKVPAGTLTASGGLTGTLIVGAGGNDVNKGTPVGTFSATLSGGTLTVSYSLTNGFDLSEVHVYAACKLPSSCAPGSYTYPSTSSPSPDLSGTANTSFQTTINVGSCTDYYLIFHAKVNQSFKAGVPCPGTVL
jgi:hypothetical protein